MEPLAHVCTETKISKESSSNTSNSNVVKVRHSFLSASGLGV